ncbi:DNA cytosine methyltransferase [Streptomyces sp.]|uniref:DNA cytosine methyltransferase n=1 Tax=Streptomyces sp. TaxID=1931 RepID=UPI002F925B92
MMRPRLLDLFCGAGGAAMGYHRAGFDVVGVDIEPQLNYPFEFIRADALEYIEEHGHEFDAVHASPPCQFYSAMTSAWPGLAAQYPDLVAPVRVALEQAGVPYVIENVPGSPLLDPYVLCGFMFELELYRHRLFETSFELWMPLHLPHRIPASRAGHYVPGTVMSVAGHVAPVAHARKIMGIDWTTRDELAEAIPPAYTQFVGAQLLDALRRAA